MRPSMLIFGSLLVRLCAEPRGLEMLLPDTFLGRKSGVTHIADSWHDHTCVHTNKNPRQLTMYESSDKRAVTLRGNSVPINSF